MQNSRIKTWIAIVMVSQLGSRIVFFVTPSSNFQLRTPHCIAVDHRFDAVRTDFQAFSAGYSDAVDARFDGVGHRVDGLRSELIATVEGAFRRQLWALLALIIALATLVLATAELKYREKGRSGASHTCRQPDPTPSARL